MRFERVHIALLSVMSIFTGMIAPIVIIDTRPIPLPMTNARELSVIILFSLAFMFYLAMERRWKLYHFLSAGITILIGWVAVEYFLGNMSDIRSGTLATGLGWSWIFLGVGILGFFVQGRESFRTIDGDEKSMFDHIIAVIGSLILLGLSGIIIFISLYGETHTREISILESYYGTGGISTGTGYTLSPPYSKAPEFLRYDRKSNILSFVVTSQTGKVLEYSSAELSKSSYDEIHPVYMSRDQVIATAKKDGTSLLLKGTSAFLIEKALFSENSVLAKSGSGWMLAGDHGTRTIESSKEIMDFQITPSGETLTWSTFEKGTSTIWKNSEALLTLSGRVENISLSKNGYDVMALVRVGRKYAIYKNPTLLISDLDINPKESYHSNGSYFIFTEKDRNKVKININGEFLPRDFEEVRHIFLEKNGGSYAFFARPVGESKWCLFTRYKGNICGLSGYMNPGIGADGGSIYFAGLKNNLWSLYRNTEVLVENTGYDNPSIIKDYFFADTTNPRKYIFYRFDVLSNTYTIIKNGKLLDGKWDDVGLEASFGYDDTVITSVKKDGNWYIVEL